MEVGAASNGCWKPPVYYKAQMSHHPTWFHRLLLSPCNLLYNHSTMTTAHYPPVFQKRRF